MSMIAIPLWPSVVAVVALFTMIFYLFKLYDEEWKYAIAGTAITAVISFLVYWIVYGMEATLR